MEQPDPARRIHQRASEMLYEARAERRQVERWRVSKDVLDALRAKLYLGGVEIGLVTDLTMTIDGLLIEQGPPRLMGLPMLMDEHLPPSAIIAEPST